MMNDETFDRLFRGKTATACGILDKGVLCFYLEWSEEGDRSKGSGFYLVHHLPGVAPEGTEDFDVAFKGDTRRRIAVNHAAGELIMIAQGGNVLRHDASGGKTERMLTRDEIVVSRNVRFIGEHFYVAGAFRRVLRRDGVETWTDMTTQLRSDLPAREMLGWGFEDVDGFDETEMYAVGGRGDAWRFDGERWHRLDLPSDASLESVCCASDGTVYLGGSGHTIIVGRGDRWELAHRAETNQRFHQLVEFDQRIFGVDDWGTTLYEVSVDGVNPVDTGDHRLPYQGARCIATGHGMLLVAGSESASLYDGTTWRHAFGRNRA
jgi:hypothetical protein